VGTTVTKALAAAHGMTFAANGAATLDASPTPPPPKTNRTEEATGPGITAVPVSEADEPFPLDVRRSRFAVAAARDDLAGTTHGAIHWPRLFQDHDERRERLRVVLVSVSARLGVSCMETGEAPV
jgi:hypothetical protein